MSSVEIMKSGGIDARAIRRLRMPGSVLAMIALSIGVTSTAGALDCRDWNRLDGNDQIYLIEDEVSAILNSGSARSWHVNSRQIERCVLRRIHRIADEVGDICAESMRHGMRAADEVIMQYVRSCVQ